MNIEIANRLVQLRKKNNLSQEALAEKLGISRQAVSKWERAEASPDTDNLILLARIYGVSLDELLKTEEEISIPPVDADSAEDNGNYVRVGFNGIHVKKHLFTNHHNFPIFLLILTIYLFIGCVWNAWHPGWLLFFLPPIWDSLAEAVEKKNANLFCWPLVTVLIYLCLGFFWLLWHPGWIVFLTIPLYYSIVEWISGPKDKKSAEASECGSPENVPESMEADKNKNTAGEPGEDCER